MLESTERLNEPTSLKHQARKFGAYERYPIFSCQLSKTHPRYIISTLLVLPMFYKPRALSNIS